MKMPAMMFYPADWRKDPAVQSMGYFERGVWFEMLCLMHESGERGVLLLNGVPMPDQALANILGLDNQTLTKTLTTILTYGVAKRREEDNAIFSKRMVKDEHLCQIRREAGKKGGNPNLVKQKSNQVVNQSFNQNPTPSVAVAFASSEDKPFKPLSKISGEISGLNELAGASDCETATPVKSNSATQGEILGEATPQESVTGDLFGGDPIAEGDTDTHASPGLSLVVPPGSGEPPAARSVSFAKKEPNLNTAEGRALAAFRATWSSYSAAMMKRYGVPAQVSREGNAMIKRFIDYIGQEEAPEVIRFYVEMNEKFYIDACHPINLLSRDQQKVMIRWKNRNNSSAGGVTSVRDGLSSIVTGNLQQKNYNVGVDAAGNLVG